MDCSRCEGTDGPGTGTPMVRMGGADFVEMKDGTKIIILGDVHHRLAELLTMHLPIVSMSPFPVGHLAVLSDAIIGHGPRRRAELMRSNFAAIYGEKCNIIADIYEGTEKVPEKRGQAPDFIKKRNNKHWKHGRK